MLATDIKSNGVEDALEAIITSNFLSVFEFEQIGDSQCFDGTEVEPDLT